MTTGRLTYEHITIGRDANRDTHAGKPIYYIFNRKAGYCMGRIFYYPSWRQWVAQFSEESIWSAGCLADVQAAIARITACKGELPGSPADDGTPLFGMETAL